MCGKDIVVVVIPLFDHERRQYVLDSVRSCTVSCCAGEKLKWVERKICNFFLRVEQQMRPYVV